MPQGLWLFQGIVVSQFKATEKVTAWILNDRFTFGYRRRQLVEFLILLGLRG
jgi:hypothetical protein